MTTFNVWDPQAPPASPDANSTEFDEDTATFDATFAKVNWSGVGHSVDDEAPGQLYAECGSGGGSLPQHHALRDLPSGDFMVATEVKHHGAVDVAGSSMVGISLADGTTPGAGNQVVAGLEWWGSDKSWARWAGKYAGFQGGSVVQYQLDRVFQPSQFIWFRRSGSNYYVGFSNTGLPGESLEKAIAPGFTPTKFGIWLRSDYAAWICVSWSFLRYWPSATAPIGGEVSRTLA